MPLEETYPALADKIITAKQEGYSEPEIQGFVRGKMHEAFKEGYSVDEVNQYLGQIKPQPTTLGTVAGGAFDAAKGMLSNIPTALLESIKPPRGLGDLLTGPEPTREIVKDPFGALGRADRGLAERFPGVTERLNAVREGLTPDINAAAEIVRTVPEESRRLTGDLAPVFGRSAEAIAPVIAGGRAAFGAPFAAATPKVLGETLGPALETVSKAGGSLASMAGLPKEIVRLAEEFAPDVVMVGLPMAFHRTYGRAPRSRADYIKAAREDPRFVDTVRAEVERAAQGTSERPFTMGGERPPAPREARPQQPVSPLRAEVPPEKPAIVAPGSTQIEQPIPRQGPISEPGPTPTPPAQPKPTRPADTSLAGFLSQSGGVSIAKSPKEAGELRARRQSPAGKRFIKAKAGITLDDAAQRAHEAGFIEEPSARALLDAIDNQIEGRKVRSTQGEAVENIPKAELSRADRQIVEAAARDKIADLVDAEGPLEFKGKTYTGAVKEGQDIRLKDAPDRVLKNAQDILSVEPKKPSDIQFDQARLVPALKMEDGTVIRGERGQGHGPVYESLTPEQRGRVRQSGWQDPDISLDAAENFFRDATEARTEFNRRNNVQATGEPEPSAPVRKIKTAEGLKEVPSLDAREAAKAKATERVEAAQQGKPSFEQTPAGQQAIIPGAEGRKVPEGPLRPKRAQTEKPMDLEQPGIRAKEPELFKKADDDVPFDVPEAGKDLEPGSLGFPEIRREPQGVPQTVNPLERSFKPPAPAKGEIPVVRRGDIIRDMENVLQVPIRSGRGNFAQMKAAGFFKVKEEVIRLKKANDMEVAAHEVGHFLSKKFLNREFSGKFRQRGAMSDELVKLGKALYGNRKPHGGYAEEGVAEFVRFYVVDPAKAKAQAPQFFKYWENLLDTKYPDLKTTLHRARDNWKRYQEQPAVARLLSQVSIGEKKPTAFTLSDLYKHAVDDLEPIRLFTKRMSEGRPPILAGDSPYTLARLFRGWMGKADLFLRDAPIDFDTLRPVKGVKPLNSILGPFKDNLDELRAYLVARRAAELSTRGKETGLARDDIRATLDQYNNKPEFVRAAEDLQAYNNALLDYVQKSGVLSKDATAAIKQLNQAYVPFYRLIEESGGKGSAGAGTSTFANLGSPVKRLKGSSREILDPLESIVKNTYAMINVADRNNIGRAMVRLAEQGEGMGKYVERVPRSKLPVKINAEEITNILDRLGVDVLRESGGKGGIVEASDVTIPEQMVVAFRPDPKIPGYDNIISVKIDGKPILYQVHPELYEAMAGLNKNASNMLIKILGIPARALRLGATTLSPEFIVRNPPRDQFSATIYSEYNYIPGVDFMRGLAHVVKNDELYQAWKAGGGEHSMLVSLDRTSLQKTLKDVLRSGQARHLAGRVIAHPIESMRMLSELGESATRVGEFAKGIKKEGGLSREAILKSSLASREVTLDFARMGETMKATGANQLVAFLNANLQGLDKMGRAFKDNPGRTLAKATATLTVPSIMLYIANYDDPRYQELPQWQRDLFWIVPTGHMDTKTWAKMSAGDKAKFNREHTIWRIPKPFELGIIFGTFPERMLDWVLKNDPKAMKEFADSFMGSLPNPIPTFAVPLIENMANYSMFRERRIVPRGKEDVEPQFQYSKGTSETAKVMGHAVGYSPAKIENLIQGWMGAAGRLALDVGDTGIKEQKGEKAESTVADRPAIRAFAARFPGQPESIERFYDAYQNAQEKKATYDALRREGKIKEANRYNSENREAIVSLGRLRSLATRMNNLRKAQDRVENDTKLSAQEKRLKIDALTFQMTALARRAIGTPDKADELEPTGTED